MTVLKASTTVLKIGDGESPEAFATIGGLVRHTLTVNQQILDANYIASTGWRNVLPASGARAVSISGSGLFTDSDSEQQLAGKVLSGAVANYQFHFANGMVLDGAFVVTHYVRDADIEGEEQFSITLESAGVVGYS